LEKIVVKSRYILLDAGLLKSIRAVTGLLLALMFVIITLAVFLRYVLNSPAFWTEEFARYAMFYMVLVGSAAATRQQQHPALTFITDKFPDGFKDKWNLFLDGLVVFVLIVIFWQGTLMAVDEWIGKTPALRISFFWVYLALPIGAFLMMVQIVAKHILGKQFFYKNSKNTPVSKED
jgi:TRAP-type C4-dicarboxylate transport system permease small subunit